jgi:RNA polymerase sigma factor (sigma-70 family)
MHLFWNRSSKNLSQLFDGISIDSEEAVFKRNSEIFAEDIAGVIRKLGFKADNQDDRLRREVLVELTSLLLSHHEKWTDLNKADIAGLLPELVRATQWKLQILNYQYSVEATTELARRGIQVLPVLGEILESFRSDNPAFISRQLVEKYLLWPTDYPNVTERALRCVINLLRHPKLFQQPVFVWNEQFQLRITDSLIETYLFDQIRLFAFMHNGDNDALPVKEFHTKLERFVGHRVSKIEKDVETSDIVQDVLLYFFEKRPAYIAKRFFVDKQLLSYIMDLGKNRKEIRKPDNKRQYEDLEQHFEEAEDNENLGIVIEIMISCIETMDKACRRVIKSRYFNQYAQQLSYAAVADLLNANAKTIEKRGRTCLEKLKECVNQKSQQLGIRPY